MDISEKKWLFARFLKVNWRKIVASIVVGVGIFMLIFFLNKMTLIAAVNGTFYAFITLFIVGILSLVIHLGFLDIVGYNALKVGWYIAPSRFDKAAKLNGTYDYTKMKEEKRKGNRFVWLMYIIISLLFLIPCVILYILLKTC